ARYCGPIRKLPHVLGCAPEIIWGGVYRDPRDVILTYGITSELYTVTANGDFQLPPDLQKEFESDRRTVIVGSELMREHGWKLREPIVLRDPQDPKLNFTFIPIAVMPTEYLARTFWFNRKLLDEAVHNLFGANIQDRASFISVRVDRAENLGLVANEIDE